MARVIWSRRAVADLEVICRQIELDSRHHARLVARRVVSMIRHIARMPEAGSIVPEYDDRQVRERQVHKYRIIYRVRSNATDVLMIRHEARLLPISPDVEAEE